MNSFLGEHAVSVRVAGEFVRFGVVGVAGFIVDTATVYALRPFIGIYGAGFLAYLTAATANWLFNRVWTFRHKEQTLSAHRQWVLFLTANIFGFALNRGAFTILVATIPFCAANPVIPVAVGALVGMGVNFPMVKRFVYR